MLFFIFCVILFGKPQIALYRRSMIAGPVSKEIDSEILFRHWHSLEFSTSQGMSITLYPYVLLVLRNASAV